MEGVLLVEFSKYQLQQIIGQNIKRIRLESGMSQEYLAEKVGLSSGHIVQVEGGFKCLSIESLIKIADALGISIDALVYGETRKASIESIVKELSSLSDEDIGKIEKLTRSLIRDFIN